MLSPQRLCECSDGWSTSDRLLLSQQWVWQGENKSFNTEGTSFCWSASKPINSLPPYNCSTHSGRHTFWHLPWSSRLVGHCSDIYPLRLRGREKSAWVCCLSNGKSRNGQSQHSSNICQHEPSLLRWDSNQEFNPLQCCWSKQVNRAVLSRTPPFFLQQYTPCLTWG